MPHSRVIPFQERDWHVRFARRARVQELSLTRWKEIRSLGTRRRPGEPWLLRSIENSGLSHTKQSNSVGQLSSSGLVGRTSNIGPTGKISRWTSAKDRAHAMPMRRICVVFLDNGFLTDVVFSHARRPRRWQQKAGEGNRGEPARFPFLYLAIN
jgi:hypothetical protein